MPQFSMAHRIFLSFCVPIPTYVFLFPIRMNSETERSECTLNTWALHTIQYRPTSFPLPTQLKVKCGILYFTRYRATGYSYREKDDATVLVQEIHQIHVTIYIFITLRNVTAEKLGRDTKHPAVVSSKNAEKLAGAGTKKGIQQCSEFKSKIS